MIPCAPSLYCHILTLMPEIWHSFAHGVIERARRQGVWQSQLWNLRDFSDRRDRRVDDRPFAGSPGMVLQTQPLEKAWDAICAQKAKPPFLIQMDPSGVLLDPQVLKNLRQHQEIAVLCGRYEGIDQRFTDRHVDLCVSVGTFVVSGGDIPAMLMLDALIRLLPGALGNAASALADSYQPSGLLDHPVYTRPRTSALGQVPEVLTSGHDQQIALWMREQMLGRTWDLHPHALENQTLSSQDIALLERYIRRRFGFTPR